METLFEGRSLYVNVVKISESHSEYCFVLCDFECTHSLCSLSTCIAVSVVINFDIPLLKVRNAGSFCLRVANRLL